MIKLFDFLYFCLYRMFKLLKRVEEKDENSTAIFYSLLLSTNSILLFFPFRFVIEKGFFDPPLLNFLLKLVLISIFIGWYFFCNSYFIKTKYYLKIFERYDKAENEKKRAIVGIIYSLVTFISFISIASLF